MRRWDLVTILPGGVFGPPLSSRKSGESVGMIQVSVPHRTQIFVHAAHVDVVRHVAFARGFRMRSCTVAPSAMLVASC
jgi:hypothetical protein